METEKTKVCIYARVSTKKEIQERSLEEQQDYFKTEINKNNNLELVKIYADEGFSGVDIHKRPGFREMLYDAGIDIKKVTNDDNREEYTKYVFIQSPTREPKFQYIYTKATSRFARNIEVVSIIRELKKKGVYIYFLTINKSTKDDDSDFVIDLMLRMDQEESKIKSAK